MANNVFKIADYSVVNKTANTLEISGSYDLFSGVINGVFRLKNVVDGDKNLAMHNPIMQQSIYSEEFTIESPNGAAVDETVKAQAIAQLKVKFL